MEDLVIMLEGFLSGEITAADFSSQFLTYWRKVRDEEYAAIEADSKLKQEWSDTKNLAFGIFGSWFGKRRWNKLMTHLRTIRIAPSVEIDGIISDLFTATDMYDDHTINEPELKQRVALELEKLRQFLAHSSTP